MSKNEQNAPKDGAEESFSIKNVIGSVAAAFLGVQSNKNRKKDFTKGKFSHFVIVGLIGVMLFIGGLVTVVSLVLP